MNYNEMIKLFEQNLYSAPILNTPFGTRNVVYADHTASGQPMKLIENYIQDTILPHYANTHSNAHSGRLMAHYIEQSRTIIRSCVGANCDDQIIYTGNGCSAAVNHFIHILNLSNRNNDEIPTVFITDFEHNSNFLPWKYAPVNLEIVSTTNTGLIDMIHFKKLLDKYKSVKIKIVSFCAGSNITGIIQDVSYISIIAHKYNCIVCFDYAALAPYVKINMHADDKCGDHIDAIFISTHKMLGGPSCPGILVANKSLFNNECPYYPSGGTVRFCSSDKVIFSSNNEIKESGGTPNIIGCIRSGLTFQLKDYLFDYMSQTEYNIVSYVRDFLNKTKNVHLLVPNCQNDLNIKQVPIFSFIIPQLHYNFVVVLLCDLFGIQSRGGVACSGLFAERILCLSKKHKQHILSQILSDQGVPSEYGFVRVTFHFTMSWTIINYILKSIKFIAKYGLLFLLLYKYIPEMNIWKFDKDNKLNYNMEYIDDVVSQKLDLFHNHKINTSCMIEQDMNNNFVQAKQLANMIIRKI
jgi:selenocysteine lyase/cysteine desulfurase